MIIFASANKILFNQKTESSMKPLNQEQKKVADQLRKELSESYPYVFPAEGAVEQYVSDGWCHTKSLTVHLLYDYIISQGLCEVEE